MTDDQKKSALVIHVSDMLSAVINKGAEQGVKPGDTYLIYSLGPEINDPETGASLGRLEIVRGRAIVRHVQEKMSTLESDEFEETPGRRKIVKRESSGPYFLSMGIPQREEIEEGPERKKRELGASKGDLAKLIAST